MHGCGNDFVVVDCRRLRSAVDFPNLARQMLDRHVGIGGDQLLLVCESQVARCRMRIFNTDGREAEMCGNGLRAVGLFVHEENKPSSFLVDTLAGPRHVTVRNDGLVSVQMGFSKLEASSVLLRGHSWHRVNMGNPHCVAVVDNVDGIVLEGLGHEMEKDWDTNVEVVQLKSRSHCVARVWERSVGITMACGSGACAIFAALRAQNLIDDVLHVKFPGGELQISLNPDGQVVMTGPAVSVFEGKWPCETPFE